LVRPKAVVGQKLVTRRALFSIPSIPFIPVKKAFKTGMKGMEGMGVRLGQGSVGRFDGQRFASKIPKIAAAILQIQISAFE